MKKHDLSVAATLLCRGTLYTCPKFDVERSGLWFGDSATPSPTGARIHQELEDLLRTALNSK